MDWLFEICGAILVIINWLYLAFQYKKIPNSVPVHFDFWGNPNIYDTKEYLWITPIFVTALYVGMTYLNRIPEILSYPVKITKENAAALYQINLRTIRIIKVLIAGEFFLVSISKVSIALEQTANIYPYHLIIFLGLLALVVITSHILMLRKK